MRVKIFVNIYNIGILYIMAPNPALWTDYTISGAFGQQLTYSGVQYASTMYDLSAYNPLGTGTDFYLPSQLKQGLYNFVGSQVNNATSTGQEGNQDIFTGTLWYNGTNVWFYWLVEPGAWQIEYNGSTLSDFHMWAQNASTTCQVNMSISSLMPIVYGSHG